MKTGKWFQEKLEKFKDDIEFLTEKVILDFTEQVIAYMKQNGINRAELAKRLGVSKAFITKLLNGNPNLTIKTMVSLAKTLDCDINIEFAPEGFEVRRFYISPAKAFNASEFTEDVAFQQVEEETNASVA